MNTMSDIEQNRSWPDSSRVPARPRRLLGALDVLVLSVWCGLAGGLLEVGARVLLRKIASTHRLYAMSRHFVWLVPMTDLLLFSGFGVLFAMATLRWPRPAGWLGPRLVCTFAVLPMFMVAGPGVYPQAWLILCLGLAWQLVPSLEERAGGLRRSLLMTLPALLGLVVILACSTFGFDRLKQWRETKQPLPSASAPNVLMIVLDTVRADRLSLYGYHRPTSPSLEQIAKRGILFQEVRAAAPWTLPSHATMFTGRWPHELDVNWAAPLGGNAPTLAEYLGRHGYATAGFAANKLYCSYDTGLDRGFTHFEDYLLDRLSPFRTARLFDLWLKTFVDVVESVRSIPAAGPFNHLLEDMLNWIRGSERKVAATVNREFLDWLKARSEPRRPFFAFLNYFDAHSPYMPPRGAKHRFGIMPRTAAELQIFDRWADIDKMRLPRRYRNMVSDSYDNCIADLDEKLGELFDDLRQSGLLDQTLVIVTADHGEGLGEHDLYDHGESLYRTEARVPLLIVPPAGSQFPAVVRQSVSSRDLPATIVDLVGLAVGSPFPGHSLWDRWRVGSTVDGNPSSSEPDVLTELASPNPANPNRGRSPAYRGPLYSLASGDFVYIVNTGDGREELFNQRDDPDELINHARDDVMQPLIERLRRDLARLKAIVSKPEK